MAAIEIGILKGLKRLRHGFMTREGGVSEGIYASLNCGPGSGDDAANVAENRARVAEILGAEPARLITLFQKHSAEVVTADKPWKDGKAPEADAIVTAKPGIAIGVLTADCAPVLLCDGEARVIGAAHAGWRGALPGARPAFKSRTVFGDTPALSAIGSCAYHSNCARHSRAVHRMANSESRGGTAVLKRQ